MTQKLNAFMLGLLLMGVLGQPALADMGNRDHGLSPEELAFVFGDPNADGFEILSPQEMAEIEGRWTFLALRQAFYRGALHVWTAARRIASYWPTRVPERAGIWESGKWRFRLGRHGAHHGKPIHWQLTYWQKGTKGQERNIWIERPIPKSGGSGH